MNTFGRSLRLTVFGSSHGPAIGCVLDGMPAGLEVDEEGIRQEMGLRRPQEGIGTPRKEEDEVNIISGVLDLRTTGAPITLMIENRDVDSSKYEQFRRLPRPGHADMPALIKYPNHDIRGGGQFSGRMTAPLVAAGALVRRILEEEDVHIGAFSRSIGDVTDHKGRGLEDSRFSRTLATRACEADLDVAMKGSIESAAQEGDSVGGVVECVIDGLPIGVGEPWFDSLESVLAHGMFSIPAVKGLEFGDGFKSAMNRGSQNNDPYCWNQGRIVTRGNRHGGILGGMSTGMPVLMRAAFKPTPSISRKQDTVDLERLVDSEVTVQGRHDPCIVPRAVPVVEAVAILTVADLMMEGGFIAP